MLFRSGIVKLPRYVVRQDQVAIVKDDNTIEIRKVNIVRTDIENVFIKDSLATGERVSITDISNLVSGQKVKLLGEESEEVEIESADPEAISLAGEQ